MNADLERIETRIAFLEQANAELSDVVYRQERELIALRAQLATLGTRLEAAQAPEQAWTAEQEKPPHY